MGGGGATAAKLSLDAAFGESRKETAKATARPRIRVVAEPGAPCCYHRLAYDFLFSLFSSLLFLAFCLVPLFVSVCPPLLFRRCSPLPRVASSVQQLSVPLEHVPGVLFFEKKTHFWPVCVTCILLHFIILFVSVHCLLLLFSVWHTRYPVRTYVLAFPLLYSFVCDYVCCGFLGLKQSVTA